ncbi:hypothetical protein GCM10009785_25430 [Brooklawnia cerclae]|uniref:Tetratricopeptide (TPR) repeat protein n=1 Tax=Brooklawnia cerclae TaxID=349934 RepID=A0ABX0SDU0_9ACTN|nr:tetratricopeptide repeat protein [Brooklawnia cerclae]NIH55493.1 tetratricopeptide (TPR) repeat protein [Brooklawnia cerclae]
MTQTSPDEPYDQADYDRVSAIREEAFKAWDTGRRADAIRLSDQWWDAIPGAKLGHMAEEQAALEMARAAAEAGDTVEARRWLARGREAYGDGDIGRELCGFVEGIVCYAEGDLDKAYAWFKASYDFMGRRTFSDKRDQTYWNFFADRAHLPRTAKKASKKTLEKLADEGDQQQAAGNLDDAIATWRQAIDMLDDTPTDHPMAMWFYASIGDALTEARRWDEADQALNQALAAGGTGNAFVWLRKGQALAELGNQKAALDALTSAYMLDGDEIFDDEDPKYRQLLIDAGVIHQP